MSLPPAEPVTVITLPSFTSFNNVNTLSTIKIEPKYETGNMFEVEYNYGNITNILKKNLIFVTIFILLYNKLRMY